MFCFALKTTVTLKSDSLVKYHILFRWIIRQNLYATSVTVKTTKLTHMSVTDDISAMHRFISLTYQVGSNYQYLEILTSREPGVIRNNLYKGSM